MPAGVGHELRTHWPSMVPMCAGDTGDPPQLSCMQARPPGGPPCSSGSWAWAACAAAERPVRPAASTHSHPARGHHRDTHSGCASDGSTTGRAYARCHHWRRMMPGGCPRIGKPEACTDTPACMRATSSNVSHTAATRSFTTRAPSDPGWARRVRVSRAWVPLPLIISARETSQACKDDHSQPRIARAVGVQHQDSSAAQGRRAGERAPWRPSREPGAGVGGEGGVPGPRRAESQGGRRGGRLGGRGRKRQAPRGQGDGPRRGASGRSPPALRDSGEQASRLGVRVHARFPPCLFPGSPLRPAGAQLPL
jgi:hypothetical protein